MLVLTPNATTVIRSLVDGEELPEGGGLRIASTNNGDRSLTVLPADAPQTGDEVVEDSGARVFVDNSAAIMIGNSVLDAEVDDVGNVQFLLTANAK